MSAGTRRSASAQAILVAVDGSAACRRALRYAAARAAAGARLHLLHVQPPLMAGEVGVLVTREMAVTHRRRATERMMRRVCALLLRRGIPHHVHMASGPVAQTITRSARRLKCGEIVMGTRGMGAVGNLLLGSVAAEVVKCAHLPVTLVK